MKVGQWPLAVKLWGVFAALTLCIFAVLAVLLPWMLKGFFTDQLYDILVDSQMGVQLEYRQPVRANEATVTVAADSLLLPESSRGAREPGAVAAPLSAGIGTVSGQVYGYAEQITAAEVSAAQALALGDSEGQAVRETELGEVLPFMTLTMLPGGLSGQTVKGVDLSVDQQVLRIAKSSGTPGEKGEQVIRHFIIGTSPASAEISGKASEAAPAVKSVPAQTIPADRLQLSGRPLPASAVAIIEQNAFSQTASIQKYKLDVNQESMLYVIRKDLLEGKPNYMVSYASSQYRNDLVMTMFARLLLLMVGLIIVSWLPCIALARYLTRPLVQMERHVVRMAERDWHEALETGRRRDEIGRLAKAIETMRQRLVRQDKSHQFFLQHISHELKTPVMVIRSYAQSIQDGVFPKGNLSGSVGVIMKESERLERRIRDLLILNKLNYFSARMKPHQSFDVKAVIEDAIERLRCRRPELVWELDIDEAAMQGDKEQWGVAFENLLDNQLRYARTRIGITLKSGAPPTIVVANDGPLLEASELDSMFEPFRTGGNGQFGLGLAIVRQIAGNHGMTVRAVNEADGVSFCMEPAMEGKEQEASSGGG
ncbi:two-component system, OmpR family, sensor histidine kinase CssS [Paenibacillus sp. UNCCL117]|uniref:sensor histidine kinase n=1 Tax=unclassified Paenibacillus TaxID=185978 RepID=UPI00088DB2E1|nr:MULTISPECIES: HAMP domain-containing sensor histidine kinase [unclassified Paenibacillus]SDD14912.1 two-component system, OmpR family, sensor histidine kinase CssS [Paenibacillus sp. cl123]SFW34331.1 two-component system, OmpR family, sensor histidine kinase CssS [Paenibacillus sp. UNCCL117]